MIDEISDFVASSVPNTIISSHPLRRIPKKLTFDQNYPNR